MDASMFDDLGKGLKILFWTCVVSVGVIIPVLVAVIIILLVTR